MLVHEALYDQRSEKLSTSVRFTAGDQIVQTDPNSKGIFQQPLTLLLEQGTSVIVGDLLDDRDRVLATIKFDPMEDVLTKYKASTLPWETVFMMKQKGKGVTNPKLKLTMMLDAPEDEESGMLAGLSMSSETRYMVKQQLAKATSARSSSKGKMTDVEMLALGSAGPVDMFQGLGEARTVYIGINGPPHQRKYTLSVWDSKHAMDKLEHPLAEAEILKIRSVQSDPSRSNVFMVNYMDRDRIAQQLSFRRIDRNRDVWVEMLQLLVKQLHASVPAKKTKTK